ncbi:MAG TPA: hypothetical protein VFB45_25745 [Pseudolabrys sp.]|nr:hypothetical protein [Pseudolabrys sp.]
MAELIFRCPYTNKPIQSGIEVDQQTAFGILGHAVRIRCPYCETSHDGRIADGELGRPAWEAAVAPGSTQPELVDS